MICSGILLTFLYPNIHIFQTLNQCPCRRIVQFTHATSTTSFSFIFLFLYSSVMKMILRKTLITAKNKLVSKEKYAKQTLPPLSLEHKSLYFMDAQDKRNRLLDTNLFLYIVLYHNML